MISERQIRLENRNLRKRSYFFKQEQTNMTSTRKKRHNTETDNEADSSHITTRRRKALKLDRNGDQEIQSSQTSTVLFELEKDFAALNNDGNTSELKVERGEEDVNHIACNDAEENQIDSKASISFLCDTINEALNNDGNTSELKVERDEEDVNHIACNDAEENQIDSKASISALCDTINEATPTKKKKKKHRELGEANLQTVTENEIDNTLTENVEENSLISEATSTKKKKKKHRELGEANLQTVTENEIDNTLTENVEENSLISEAVEMAAKKKKKKKKKSTKYISSEDSMENEKRLAVSEEGEGSNNADIEETDRELTFLETRQMFEDMQQKLMSSVSSKHFWDEYTFHPFSNENCKVAFEKIMIKVQKKRTMLELVSAAGKLMEESPNIFFDKSKQIKPTSAFKLYSESYYKKISKKHPEYRGIQILNKLTKKWAKLADHKKLKYINLALAKRDEYLEEIKHCYQIDPSFVAKPILNKVEWQLKDRCSGLPETPPRTGFALFVQKSNELYTDLSHQDRTKKLAVDFKALPSEVRKKYDSQVKELSQNYKAALSIYLDSLSPGEREERNYTYKYKQKKSKEKTSSKTTEKHIVKNKIKRPEQIKKPPKSGYILYYSELNDILKEVPVIQRHVIVSEKWKALSEDERIEYNKKRLLLYDEWLNKLKLSVNEKIAEPMDNDG